LSADAISRIISTNLKLRACFERQKIYVDTRSSNDTEEAQKRKAIR
jgi:hypothetical protein